MRLGGCGSTARWSTMVGRRWCCRDNPLRLGSDKRGDSRAPSSDAFFFVPDMIHRFWLVVQKSVPSCLHGCKYEAVDAKKITAVPFLLFQIGNPVGCLGV